MTLNVPLEEHLRPKQTVALTTPLCFIYNQKLCAHSPAKHEASLLQWQL